MVCTRYVVVHTHTLSLSLSLLNTDFHCGMYVREGYGNEDEGDGSVNSNAIAVVYIDEESDS
jgi:hypothetical protein